MLVRGADLACAYGMRACQVADSMPYSSVQGQVTYSSSCWLAPSWLALMWQQLQAVLLRPDAACCWAVLLQQQQLALRQSPRWSAWRLHLADLYLTCWHVYEASANRNNEGLTGCGFIVGVILCCHASCLQ